MTTETRQEKMWRLAETALMTRQDRQRCENALEVLRSKEQQAARDLQEFADAIEREKRIAERGITP